MYVYIYICIEREREIIYIYIVTLGNYQDVSVRFPAVASSNSYVLDNMYSCLPLTCFLPTCRKGISFLLPAACGMPKLTNLTANHPLTVYTWLISNLAHR